MSLPLTAVIGGATGRRTGSSPPDTLPTVLKNRDVVIYGPRLAETYAVGDPMPTIGEPTLTAFDAAREATLRETPGGFDYLQSTLDGYTNTTYTPSPNNITAWVMGRNWSTIFASSFGFWGSGINCLFNWRGPVVRAITANGGVNLTTVSPTVGVDEWWLMAIRVDAAGNRTIWWNDAQISSTPGYGNLDTADASLVVMKQGPENIFGSGDIYLAGYDTTTMTDAELLEIYALRPTS